MISGKHLQLPSFFMVAFALMQSAFSQLEDQPVAMDKAPFHVPVFSNDYVTMLRINIPPGRDTGFHTHYFGVREPFSSLTYKPVLRIV